MQSLASGPLEKMRVTHNTPITYRLPVGDAEIPLNDLLGQTIKLNFIGTITCTHCGRKTKKSFNQGYCFPCLKRLAQCDQCIVSPEKCHYFEGTCREPEWGDAYCMQAHFVYLANSSGLKVGITRGTQIPTRWIDQGAVQAMPIAHVQTRQQSGFVEVALKKFVRDRTDWRAMLKGVSTTLDLAQRWAELREEISAELSELKDRFGDSSITLLEDERPLEFEYPVLEYPSKISTHNFDKNQEVTGRLNGIKGQYLILDTGVINIRKFTSYHVEVFV